MEAHTQATEPSEQEVSAYLQQHPQFFQQHTELLAALYLPSPHGSGTVSLAERQQLAQRDKIRVLENRLSEFLQYGKENDSTSDKVHRLSLCLLAAQQLEILLPLLSETLRQDFAVPYVNLRLWATPKLEQHIGNPAFAEVDQDLRNWAESLEAPYCGNRPGLDSASWFGAEATPKSYALIPLRSEQVFGLLAIAADDEQRFHADMATLFLKRIGELVSAALLRYID